MKSSKRIDYIEKFRKEHNEQITEYVRPEMKSEQVFSVGYDIRPFALCVAKGSKFSFVNNVCFS